MDSDPNWPGREAVILSKQMVEDKFNVTFSQGLGRVYPPSGLLKSYQEALVAVAIPRLMGKKHFIQFFSDLGIFSAIFSHDKETIQEYCLQTLGKIMEHDDKNDTELLNTLRVLLDNDCSWKTTADKLYVHVNTVHYRLSKIEKLLDIDFSVFDTRINLFTGIKSWDTLQVCGLMD